MSNLTSLKVVDLFAGCGGLSLGFELAGFSVAAAYDSWQPAIDCYKSNFKTHEIHSLDLSDVEVASKIIHDQRPDIIIGGPPCQDFSQAGKRIEKERATLTKCFANIVKTVQPKFFVMENVARARQSSTYQETRKLFSEAGYGLTECILDASLYDVPQRRKRFFVIGGLSLQDNALSDAIEAHESLIPLTVRKACPDFPFDHYYRHPRSYARRAIFSVDEPAPTIRGVNRPKPKSYQPHEKDSSTDSAIRALSTKERALIQTFPTTFEFPSSNKTDTDQMIGNAVPVNLARSVAEVLAQNILDDTQNANDVSFRKWLISERQMGTESAKDKISHIRRANKCVAIPDLEDLNNDYLDALIASDKFGSASQASQRQMRKAVELLINYIHFIQEPQQRKENRHGC